MMDFYTKEFKDDKLKYVSYTPLPISDIHECSWHLLTYHLQYTTHLCILSHQELYKTLEDTCRSNYWLCLSTLLHHRFQEWCCIHQYLQEKKKKREAGSYYLYWADRCFIIIINDPTFWCEILTNSHTKNVVRTTSEPGSESFITYLKHKQNEI